MKLAVFSTVLCASLSMAQAQDLTVNGTNQVELENKTNSEEKSFDISVGYTNTTIKRITSDIRIDRSSETFNGVSLSAGKIFDLSRGFSTTTSLIGSYNTSKYTAKDMDKYVNNMYLVGVSQRFSYSIETSLAVLKPFVEADYSIGLLSTFRNNKEFGEETTKSYGGGLGLQASLANGITPFVKYNYSFVNNDAYTGKEGEEKMSTLNIGVGYVF